MHRGIICSGTQPNNGETEANTSESEIVLRDTRGSPYDSEKLACRRWISCPVFDLRLSGEFDEDALVAT
jgi:hypothetical protein